MQRLGRPDGLSHAMGMMLTTRNARSAALKSLFFCVAILALMVVFAPMPMHHSSGRGDNHQERRQHKTNSAAKALAALFDTVVSKTAMEVGLLLLFPRTRLKQKLLSVGSKIGAFICCDASGGRQPL